MRYGPRAEVGSCRRWAVWLLSLGLAWGGTAATLAAAEETPPPPPAEGETAADQPAQEPASPAAPEQPEQKGPFTGLIVDASAVHLERAMSPKIRDAHGNLLFPPPDLAFSVEEIQERGIAGYAPNLAEARQLKERIGDNPLVGQAVATDEDDPMHATAILDAPTAARLRAADAETHFLRVGRVVFLIGLKVLSVTPPSGAKDVPLESPVVIVVSKHILPQQLARRPWVKVCSAEGAMVEGTLSYTRLNRTLTFTPASPLAPGVTYKVTIARDLTAQNRCQLGEEYTWTFTTAAPNPPAPPAEPLKEAPNSEPPPPSGETKE